MKIELNSLGCCSKLQQRQARSILFSFSILIRFDKKYISTCGLNKFLQISPLERYISFAYRLNWYTSLEEIFFKVDRQHDILEKTCIKISLGLWSQPNLLWSDVSISSGPSHFLLKSFCYWPQIKLSVLVFIYMTMRFSKGPYMVHPV